MAYTLSAENLLTVEQLGNGNKNTVLLHVHKLLQYFLSKYSYKACFLTLPPLSAIPFFDHPDSGWSYDQVQPGSLSLSLSLDNKGGRERGPGLKLASFTA